jgi:hypothetical protein
MRRCGYPFDAPATESRLRAGAQSRLQDRHREELPPVPVCFSPAVRVIALGERPPRAEGTRSRCAGRIVKAIQAHQREGVVGINANGHGDQAFTRARSAPCASGTPRRSTSTQGSPATRTQGGAERKASDSSPRLKPGASRALQPTSCCPRATVYGPTPQVLPEGRLTLEPSEPRRTCAYMQPVVAE